MPGHILAGKTSIPKYSNIQIFEIKIIEYTNICSSMLHFFEYIQIFVEFYTSHCEIFNRPSAQPSLGVIEENILLLNNIDVYNYTAVYS